VLLLEDRKTIDDSTLVSFAPLFATLHEKGMKVSQLRSELRLSPATVARLGRDRYISLENVAEIARYLNVPLHKVVEMKIGVLRDNRDTAH
jgi:DNA-binding Xre family transcriptional regulator